MQNLPGRAVRLQLSSQTAIIWLSVQGMTKEQFDAELQRGYDDYLAGNMIDAREVYASLKKEYGI